MLVFEVPAFNYSPNTTKHCEYVETCPPLCLPYLCTVLQRLCPFSCTVHWRSFWRWHLWLLLECLLNSLLFLGKRAQHTQTPMQTPQNASPSSSGLLTPALFPVFVLLMRQTALLELFRVLLPAFRTILGASFKFRRVLPVSLAARAQANGTGTKSL